MSLLRYPSILGCLTLLGLAVASLPRSQAQEPALPRLDVPIKDAPPTLSLPLPRPATTVPGQIAPPMPVPGSPGAAAQKSPESGLPGLAPAAPPKSDLPPGFKPFKPSSTAGQFTIHGADLPTRTWFSQRLEAISDDLIRVLRDPEPWSLPIVISIKTPPDINPNDAAVRTNISQLAEGGFHLQLTVQLKPDFNTNDLRSELIRMLLAERILRSHKELTTTRGRILPDWLLVGITEAMRYRERSKPSALFGAVFKSGKVYGIEEILGVSPGTLDAMSRTIYEVSACALVLALVEQPEGGQRMSKFLSALAIDNRSDRELIDQWFPGIAQSKSSLDKWWSLQMANLARPSVFESLDPTETAKALDHALMLRYATESESAPVAAVSKGTAEGEEAAPVEEIPQEHQGVLSRWFGRNKDARPADALPAAPEPVRTPPTEEQTMPTQRPGLFGRLFGGGDKEKKDETAEAAASEPPKKPEARPEPAAPEPKKETPKPAAKPEPKPEPKPATKPAPKTEAPKPAAKAEPKPKTETKKDDIPDEAPPPTVRRKPLLNRLFNRSEDKPAEEAAPAPEKAPEPQKGKAPKGEAPADKKDGAAQAFPPAVIRALAGLAVPGGDWLMLAGQWLDSASHEGRFAILGFGKKKDKEKAAEEEAAKAAAESKPAAKGKGKSKEPEKAKEQQKASEKPKETKPEPKKEKEAAAEAPKPKPAPAPTPAPKRKTMVTVSVPLDEYSKVTKRSDAKIIFENTTKELVLLTQRAHPLFRPIIVEYIAAVADISKGKTKDMDARLKDLAGRRAEALKLSKAVQDHLDWYEASENDKWSGLFDDFLRVPRTVEEELPQRTDPLSKLLDEAEKTDPAK